MQVSQSAGQIEIREPMSPVLRVFLVIFGCVPFLAPYELLFRPRWQEINLIFVVFLLISLGAVLVGGSFILGGLLGLSQTLRFTAQPPAISYAYESALLPLRRKIYVPAELSALEIHTHTWESRPETFGLKFAFADGTEIKIGDFSSRPEGEECLRQIQLLFNR